MKERDPELLLFHAPLLRQGMTTPKAMRDVILALMPATGASLWFFGLSAVLVIGASIAGAVAAEWLAPTGLLAMEVGAGQARVVRGLADRRGYRDLRVLADLRGIDRVVAGVSPAPAAGRG